MDFLEKLDYLMKRDGLNKNKLSKLCNIPYTTIDGWYKKGYEGLKLTTLRKLSSFFGTSLDFWANDEIDENLPEGISKDEQQLLQDYRSLSDQGQEYIRQTMVMALNTYKKDDAISDMEEIG